jgi:hypothetical protein
MHMEYKFKATGGKIYLDKIDTIVTKKGKIISDSVMWKSKKK